MFRSPTHVRIPEPEELQKARDKRLARAAAAVRFEVRSRDVRAAVQDYPESELLVLDDQTFQDLEIFESEMEGGSLFDFCNHTRNHKGAGVLRARMRRPFSSPARIIAAQESVAFLKDNLHLFERLPTFATTDLVENYIHGILPLVVSNNAVEFFLDMMDIRFGDYVRYHRIMAGVETASSFIQVLRVITQAPDLVSPPGELAGLLEEMRALLAAPGFSLITGRKTWKMWPWTVLRIDQVFRIHEKETLFRLLRLTYEVDALLAMAITTRKHGLVMPVLAKESLHVEAEGVVHPLVEKAVANPVSLDQVRRLLFLTGPNMAGKTTYLRASAIAIYLAHLGMGVPARTFRFTPAQRLFSSISLADNLSMGVSFFRAEALRIKAIAEALAMGYRVIAIMDEPFKGTNLKDALDASLAILLRFADREDNLFMFSSHLIEMEDRIKDLEQVSCSHFEAEENDGPLRFEYTLRQGISSQRLGMRVLSEEGIFDLLDKKI